MHWYLVYTKPRQERAALQNLEHQGYECYLPLLQSEKILNGDVALALDPLFPRYLFIRLGLGGAAKSWAPIRSTKGVSRLVSFGMEPARVDERIVGALKGMEAASGQQPKRMFAPGDRVRICDGVFNGLEGVFQLANGERRVMVLIELMSKLVTVGMAPSNLRKLG